MTKKINKLNKFFGGSSPKPKLTRLPRTYEEELEEENEQLVDELYNTLEALIILKLKFDKVLTITGFTDIDSIAVDPLEVQRELNKLDVI